MQRSKIKDILSRDQAGGEVQVQGWVKTRRSSKTVAFLHISDGSTLGDLQIVADASLPNFSEVWPDEGDVDMFELAETRECRNGRLGPLTVAATLTRPFLRTEPVRLPVLHVAGGDGRR